MFTLWDSYVHVTHLNVKSWLQGVGSHPLGHDLVFVDEQYVGWTCHTCHLHMMHRREDIDVNVLSTILQNPATALQRIQDNYREQLPTIWDHLL